MVRIVILGQMEDLTDRVLERHLKTNIEYKFFCDLTFYGRVPDHSTICRFRNELGRRNLLDPLLKEVNRQLVEAGFKSGWTENSVVDASNMEGPITPPRSSSEEGSEDASPKTRKADSPPERAKGKAGTGSKASVAKAPKSKESASRTPVTDAAWGRKGNKLCYGFNTYQRVDEVGFVEKVSTLPANESECPHLETMVEGCTSNRVLTDKGYSSAANRKMLAEKGIEDGIMHRAARNRPLTEEQKEFNRIVSKRRWVVEQAFGTLKRRFKSRRARYRTSARVEGEMTLKAIGMNMLKAINMSRKQSA